MTDFQERIDDHNEERLIDHLLGEQTDAERAETRAAIEDDFELAVECAELRTLFDDMRSLTVEPTGEVELAVRYAVDRRAQLRGTAQPPQRLGWRIAQVLAIAATVLFSLVLVDRVGRPENRSDADATPATTALSTRTPPQNDDRLADLLATDNLPVRDPSFVDALARFESKPLPDSFAGWLSASDDFQRLREEYRLRFAPDERHALLRSIGSPNLDHRLDTLATTVADGIRARLRADEASVEAVSLAMRSLLAAGSSRVEGPHADMVHACAIELLERLERDDLDDGALATTLAALSELSVVEGGYLVNIVGQFAEQLAEATLSELDSGRPELLHWRTPASSLADAGRVLRIAPAFGVHAGLAFRARVMIAAHLDERRLVETEIEAPGLIAAQLYGFGDLIDYEAADRELRLWNPRLLVPNYVALHHIAWSKPPTRPGWAEFQQELRGLSSLTTPAHTRDAAALLLCLTMNFAAPGALIAVSGAV